MATTTQTVIIDFQADFSSVEDAVSTLEKAGKVDADLAAKFRATNAEINKQGQAFDKTATTAGRSTQSFSRLSDLMKAFPKSGMNRFLLQIGNELAAAGVKAKDFYTKLDPKDAVSKQTSLRNELRQVREQMQQAALAGGVLGEEYKRLKQRAGELDDTIKDVNNDIANSGSDTRGIDNVVGSISALAGGYSAVQGAVALFGQENEELQKALLKVNAAMALATGLQQISNALTKQGSIVRLADAIATGYQSAAQVIYTAVTGRATAATIAFRVALAATGIGLVVVGIIALSNALKKTNKDMEDATEAVDRYSRELDGLNTILDQNLSIELSRAKVAGKAESDLIRIRGKSLLQQRANLVETNKLLAQQRDSYTDVSAAIKLNNAIEENRIKLQQIDTDLLVTQNELQAQLNEERKTAAEKALQLQKEQSDKARELAKKARAAELEDAKAAIEDKLVFAQIGSERELELRKQLLGAELDITLNNEEITRNQRLLAVSEYFKAYDALQKEFNKKLTAAAIEDQRNRDAAILENLNLSEEERLEVRIEFLQLGAAQEIALAEGNAAKIKAINAKLQAEITAEKIASIKRQADYEIALSSARGGAGKRALDAVAANEKLKADTRINAIRQSSEIEIGFIDRSIKANRDAAAIQGADQRSLGLEYAQLLDAKAAKTEETEKKITDITKAEEEKRLANSITYIQATLSGLNEIANIIGEANANSQAAADQAIETKKREVQELLEAGAITEREALQRNKRIEAEERKAKQRAAQQQKNLAVFQAFLAIPQAFIAGLTAPFPVGGPLYAAILAGLATVQAGLVASRPVPKFATGKKGSYKGLAEVGEVGAELIQRSDGSMEVATHRQMVYLGSRDKVFTAGETKNILPFVNKEAIAASGKGDGFNYEKLAAAVKQKQQPGTTVNIDKEFISESVADGIARVNYFNRYYSSKL